MPASTPAPVASAQTKSTVKQVTVTVLLLVLALVAVKAITSNTAPKV